MYSLPGMCRERDPLDSDPNSSKYFLAQSVEGYRPKQMKLD